MPEKHNTKASSQQPSGLSGNSSVQKTLESGKTVIGIDIGCNAVAVAQAAMHNGRPILLKTVVEPIPVSTDKDLGRTVTDVLKRILSKFNTRKADVVCVMPSLDAVVDTMVMPVMPPEELADAIRLEVGSSQHFVIDKPVLDFQVIGRIVDKGAQKMNVLVAGASQGALDALLTRFVPRHGGSRAEAVGIPVDRVIPLSVALENVVKASALRTAGIVAVVEMGTIATELNIYRNSQLEFSRKIPVTGSDLTRSLTSALFTSSGKLELSMDEAEAIKREFGIPAPGENYLIHEKITSAQVLSLLRPKLEQMASEISRSFDYYDEKMRSGKVGRIIVLGGGSRLKGLTEFLNAELGLPVETGDLLKDVHRISEMALPHKEDAQRLVLAVGAAFSDASGINILPAAMKDRKQKMMAGFMLALGAVVFLGVLAFAYFGSMARMNFARARAEQAVTTYQNLVPKMQELKNILLLKKMIRNRPDMGGFLKQLSYLPASVYLTELSFANGRIRFSGFVAGSEKDMKELPVQLAGELRKGVLLDAKNVPGKKTVPGKTTPVFEIEGRLGSSGGAR